MLVQSTKLKHNFLGKLMQHSNTVDKKYWKRRL